MKTVFALIMMISSAAWSYEISGNWIGNVEINGTPYKLETDIFQYDFDSTQNTFRLQTRTIIAGNEFFDQNSVSENKLMLGLINGKGMGTGVTKPSGQTLEGYYLQGNFGSVSPVFEGAVVEYLCETTTSGGYHVKFCQNGSDVVGRFKIGRRGDSYGWSLEGILTMPSGKDNSVEQKLSCAIVVYDDGVILGTCENTVSGVYTGREFVVGKANGDELSFYTFYHYADKAGKPATEQRIFEGQRRGFGAEGEVFLADWNPGADPTKKGPALGKFSLK